MVPAMAEPAEIAAAVEAAIERHAHRAGALLPLLHEVQDRLGYLPSECEGPIARALNLSRAEVHGVISYYHHFRTEAPARHVIQVCRAESCQAMGAEALYQHVLQRTGCSGHAPGGHACRSADGAYQVEPVYCLGLCAASPALMIGQSLHARVSPSRFDALVEGLEDGKR